MLICLLQLRDKKGFLSYKLLMLSIMVFKGLCCRYGNPYGGHENDHMIGQCLILCCKEGGKSRLKLFLVCCFFLIFQS